MSFVGLSPTSLFWAESVAQTLPSQRATPQMSVLSAQSKAPRGTCSVGARKGVFDERAVRGVEVSQRGHRLFAEPDRTVGGDSDCVGPSLRRRQGESGDCPEASRRELALHDGARKETTGSPRRGQSERLRRPPPRKARPEEKLRGSTCLRLINFRVSNRFCQSIRACPRSTPARELSVFPSHGA